MSKYPKTLTEVDAAKRLGVLTDFILSTDLPDAARQAAIDGDPASHILVTDGRAVHGKESMVVWLAEQIVAAKQYRVVGKAHTLPRFSAERPNIYVEAEKLGIAVHVLRRRGYAHPNKAARMGAPRGAKEDLTGVTLILHADAKS